jgi:hypothetical protein
MTSAGEADLIRLRKSWRRRFASRLQRRPRRSRRRSTRFRPGSLPPTIANGRWSTSLRSSGIRSCARSAASYGPALAAAGGASTRRAQPTRPAREFVDGHPRRLFARADDRQLGAEKRYFRPGIFPDVSTTGNWYDVSHYTTMIWPTTERVGCAHLQQCVLGLSHLPLHSAWKYRRRPLLLPPSGERG